MCTVTSIKDRFASAVKQGRTFPVKIYSDNKTDTRTCAKITHLPALDITIVSNIYAGVLNQIDGE